MNFEFMFLPSLRLKTIVRVYGVCVKDIYIYILVFKGFQFLYLNV